MTYFHRLLDINNPQEPPHYIPEGKDGAPLLFLEGYPQPSGNFFVWDPGRRKFAIWMSYEDVSWDGKRPFPAGVANAMAVGRGILVDSIPCSYEKPLLTHRLSACGKPHLTVKMFREFAKLCLELESRRIGFKSQAQFIMDAERGECLVLPGGLAEAKKRGTISPLRMLKQEIEHAYFNKKGAEISEILLPLHQWYSDKKSELTKAIRIFEALFQKEIASFLLLPLSDEVVNRITIAAAEALQSSRASVFSIRGEGLKLQGFPECCVKPLPDRGTEGGRSLIFMNRIAEGSHRTVFRSLLVEGQKVHSTAVLVSKQVVARKFIAATDVVSIAQFSGLEPRVVPIWEVRLEAEGNESYSLQIQELMEINLKQASDRMLLKPLELNIAFWQALLALKFFHKYKMVFSDFKPDNVFLTLSKGVLDVKVGDITGLAGAGKGLGITSPMYSSPEAMEAHAFKGTKVDISHDIWSFGVSLVECYFRWNMDSIELRKWYNAYKKGLSTSYQIEDWLKVVEAKVDTLIDDFPSNIIQACLNRDPKARPTVDLLQEIFNERLK